MRNLDRLASSLASQHVRHPRFIISLFVVSCSLVTTWVAVLPTKILTDYKTLISRGTDIAAKDQVVETLQNREPPLQSGSTLFHSNKQTPLNEIVSFLFETFDPSDNVFDTPYAEFLCEVQSSIKETPSWSDACEMVAETTSSSSGNCTDPISIIGLSIFFTDGVDNTMKNIIREITSPGSASLLAGDIKSQCITSGTPPCSQQSMLGCDAWQCGSPCKVEGLDICHLLQVLDPSEEELLSLADLANVHPPGASGCSTNEFDFSSFDRLLTSLPILIRFGEHMSGIPDVRNLLPFGGGGLLVSREAALAAKDSETTGQRIRSNITRIAFSLDHEAPEYTVGRFVQEAGAKAIELAESRGLRASWGHDKTFGLVINDALLRDAKRSVFAALFVTMFAVWYTQSLLLTGGAMMCVLGSIPISGWIYRVIFDIHWIGVFTFAALFLTVGIGVDDVFVTLDYWKGAPSNLHDSIEDRLTWTLEHSIVSMGITSTTTAAAFLANILSPIAPVRLFGAIMTILVVVNYILVLLVFPSFIVLAEEASNRPKNGQYSRIKLSQSTPASDESKENEDQPSATCTTVDCDGVDSRGDADVKTAPLISVVTDWIVCNAERIALMSTMVLVVLGYTTTSLQGPDALNNVFDEHHNMQRYIRMEKQFDSSPAGAVIIPTLVWGVMPKDVVDRHDPLAPVPIELDGSFELENEVAQKWLLDLCTDLSSPKRPETDRILPGSLRCFLLDLHQWLEAEVRNSISTGSTLPRGLPVSEEQWSDVVSSFLHSSASAAVTTATSGLWFDGNNATGRASVLEISFRTRTAVWQPWQVIYDEREYWESWLNSRLETAPINLKNGFLGSRYCQWSIMEALRVLTPTVVTSVMASALFAFCVLLVGTRSIMVTLVALLCISGVLVSFLAFMVVSGWSLNMIESCCVALVFGISVDYIAHVAVAYVNAPDTAESVKLSSNTCNDAHADAAFNKRRDEAGKRCCYALGMIGTSVFNGMITTVGASTFLWGCEVLILARFGIFVAFTLVTAFLVATIIFPAIVISIGLCPRRSTGVRLNSIAP